MSFRDDHDAALARADAAEAEARGAKEERDALAAKVKELEGELAARPRPQKQKLIKAAEPVDPDAAPDPRTTRIVAVVFILLVLGMIALMISDAAQTGRR